MNGSLVIASLSILCLAAAAPPEWQKWKERQDSYRREAAIVAAKGEGEAARLRSTATELEHQRLTALGARQSITRERVEQSNRDRKVADVVAREAAERLRLARDEKDLEGRLSRCQGGDAAECDRASRVFESIFSARKTLAALAIEKIQAELDYAVFRSNGYRALAASDAIDAAVAIEEEFRVEARRAELRAAQEHLALLAPTAF